MTHSTDRDTVIIGFLVALPVSALLGMTFLVLGDRSSHVFAHVGLGPPVAWTLVALPLGAIWGFAIGRRRAGRPASSVKLSSAVIAILAPCLAFGGGIRSSSHPPTGSVTGVSRVAGTAPKTRVRAADRADVVAAREVERARKVQAAHEDSVKRRRVVTVAGLPVWRGPMLSEAVLRRLSVGDTVYVSDELRTTRRGKDEAMVLVPATLKPTTGPETNLPFGSLVTVQGQTAAGVLVSFQGERGEIVGFVPPDVLDRTAEDERWIRLRAKQSAGWVPTRFLAKP